MKNWCSSYSHKLFSMMLLSVTWLRAQGRIFSSIARKVKCYFWLLTSSYSELTRKPTHKQKSPHELLFASKVFPCPSLGLFSDQLRMRKQTDFRFGKNLRFRRSLNWINFFFIWHVSPPNTEYRYGKHWFFQIIFFENFMGISVLFISLKRTFFKMKRKPCLAGCKNEYSKYPNCVARRQI